MTTNSSTDRIEKTIDLRAPRSRVWRAITDATEFGAWFGVAFDGTFAAGKPIRGKITNKGYEHITMEVAIDRIDAESLFSFGWHPYALDPKVDYSIEEPTLVEFMLEEIPTGTRLKVVESGFDRVPAARRDEAFRMNGKGWAAQMQNIDRHVSG
jgi:uncharacterized protein YndB with AHSA1/START domain